MDSFPVLRACVAGSHEWIRRTGRRGVSLRGRGCDLRSRRGLRGFFKGFSWVFSDQLPNEGFKDAKHLINHRLGGDNRGFVAGLWPAQSALPLSSSNLAGKPPATTAAPRDDSASLLIYAQFICLMSLHCFRAS
jgi:hypothetical protein